LTFSTQGYNRNYIWKRVTSLSESFYILTLCFTWFKTVIGGCSHCKQSTYTVAW